MSILSRWDKKYWFLLLLIICTGLLIHINFWHLPSDYLKKQDIYYIWLEGKRIISGENPYARVLTGDMRVNDKYATYFPLVYLFCALVQKLGFPEFDDWLYLWRPISFGFHIGIVGLTLRYFQQRGLWILGFVASSIILLSRWSIYIVKVHHLEFAAIFFLLVSLILLKQNQRFSLLMFSVSLGIKQIGIFLLPLYLIYIWKNGAKNNPIEEIFFGFCIILSVPVLTSLPFIIWNAEGFFKSILFSATRLGDSHIEFAPSVDVVFSQKFTWVVGLKAKLLMFFFMGMVYLSFLKEKVSIFVSSTMTMMIFLYFNSVLFLQYFLWSLCLIPFALVELIILPSQQSQVKPVSSEMKR
ncbi:MAG: hypothetical protein WBA93_10800 [Microcoleaceae cyanobacterium]